MVWLHKSPVLRRSPSHRARTRRSAGHPARRWLTGEGGRAAHVQQAAQRRSVVLRAGRSIGVNSPGFGAQVRPPTHCGEEWSGTGAGAGGVRVCVRVDE